MGTYIVLGILVVVVVLALVPAVKHIKGEGGCCGGSGSGIKETKTLDAPKIGELELDIEGMHCENCKNSIERRVNKLEGAVCRVNLRKKQAIVEYSRPIDQDAVKRAIEAMDFQVKSIRNH